MIAFEQRASAILFNLVRSWPVEGVFLLPANICPIVALVFFKARRPFEFIDVNPATMCMDHEAIIRRWSESATKPAGIIYARTYGTHFDTSNIFSEIKSLSPSALIVDDRCLCPPEFDEPLSPNVDATIYSTGRAKYVDVGFGGFAILRDGIPYVKSDIPFNKCDLESVTRQYKKALTERMEFSYQDSNWLDATAPSENWESYKKLVEHESNRAFALKAEINSIYASQLSVEIQFPPRFQSWRFNIHVQEKETVLHAIRRAGLFASGHYDALPGVFGAGDSVVAQLVHRHVINLFNDRYFSPNQAIEMSALLKGLDCVRPGPLFV